MIFLDVDGPLIPLRARPGSRPATAPGDGGNPLLDRLDPVEGQRLLGLGCELVWATTWMHEANEIVAPRLGLPRLPVVDWPDEDDDPRDGLHWKTIALTRWADGRPFVWLDDETTGADRRWVAANHPGRALVHRVDPLIGLTNADFTAVERWLGQASPQTWSPRSVRA
ncbi:HAD domain-containing protein [Winogradskya humida]|uniref:HAD domain-containing protein n=1 Tax=Winogradskya humida TaxID=113566 RepID=UPI001940AF0A|nr:HAD domain-containing protein [Actinoplanes humidus]